MKKKTKRQLKFEARERDIQAFNQAMEFGDGWNAFNAHERVTGTLRKFGYIVDDMRVRAIAAVAVRAAMDELWSKKIRQSGSNGELSPEGYSTEIDVPFLVRY